MRERHLDIKSWRTTILEQPVHLIAYQHFSLHPFLGTLVAEWPPMPVSLAHSSGCRNEQTSEEAF
jgi:hypothetical protein